MDKEQKKRDEAIKLFGSVVDFLRENYGVSLQELVEINQQTPKEISVPAGVFSFLLSPSEALCKYLKEKFEFNFHELGKLIGRDERSVWTSYRRAIKKMPSSFYIEERILIPVSIFKDRKLSILEHVVVYLKDNLKFTNYKTAKLLNKKPGAIYTAYKRAKKK